MQCQNPKCEKKTEVMIDLLDSDGYASRYKCPNCGWRVVRIKRTEIAAKDLSTKRVLQLVEELTSMLEGKYGGTCDIKLIYYAYEPATEVLF